MLYIYLCIFYVNMICIFLYIYMTVIFHRWNKWTTIVNKNLWSHIKKSSHSEIHAAQSAWFLVVPSTLHCGWNAPEGLATTQRVFVESQCCCNNALVLMAKEKQSETLQNAKCQKSRIWYVEHHYPECNIIYHIISIEQKIFILINITYSIIYHIVLLILSYFNSP